MFAKIVIASVAIVTFTFPVLSGEVENERGVHVSNFSDTTVMSIQAWSYGVLDPVNILNDSSFDSGTSLDLWYQFDPDDCQRQLTVGFLYGDPEDLFIDDFNVCTVTSLVITDEGIYTLPR